MLEVIREGGVTSVFCAACVINAAELMQMARMRLCRQASVETRMVMTEIRDAVVEVNPEFADFLQPKCVIHGGCNEFVPCGYWKEHADD